jgi:hypothetical protein
LLQSRVGAERLQLHQVAADVIQAHVGEAPPRGGDGGGGGRLGRSLGMTESSNIISMT